MRVSFVNLGHFWRRGREIDGASEEFSDFVLERLQLSVRSLTDIREILTSSPNVHFSATELQVVSEYVTTITQLLGILQSLSQQWEVHIDNLQSSDIPTAYHVPVVASEGRGRGRPRFDIGRDQLEYLSSLNFTWTAIASMLGVSRMTIHRRHREFNMLEMGEAISDANLLHLLREMRATFPEMGEVMVLGRLRARGYRVSRDRVRRGIRETDPLNTALRGLTGRTARRPYLVPGLNSLWHIGTFYCKEYVSSLCRKPYCIMS